MEICFLKSRALDTLKNGLPQIYDKYFTQRDNSWLADVCGENPFVKFRDVPDFELAPLERGFEPKVDFDNCKILYKKLNFLTPRQAADERFWAGLCHGVFYDYVRRRWSYDTPTNLSDNAKIITGIKNRFFFNGDARQCLLTNTLSKYWWTRYIFSSDDLNILGAENFYTKIFSIVSRSFIGNKSLRNGFVKFLRHFKEQGITLDIKNHIRPAMSQLNKRGGAIVLDCLTEEEIAAIMIEHVEKIFAQREQSATSNKKFFIPINPIDTRTVELNSRITVVSLRDDSRHIYKTDNRLKKKFSDVFNELIGKKIYSVVTLRDGKYKITDIT